MNLANASLINAGKLKVNDVTMYYELHGKGKGTPLILIAGFSCDRTFWSGILNALATNHKVLVMDNRGIGQSDCPDAIYSINRMADDVMELVSQLGLQKPVIIGQSMGSAIAQQIGKRYPERVEKIVLMNTFTHLAKVSEITFELIGELHRMNLPLFYRVQSIVPWVYSNTFLSEPNQLKNIINLAEQSPYPQTLIGYERQLGALKSFDSRAWLDQIKTPTLIIAGEEDMIAPLSCAKEVQKAMGNPTQIVVVPGGHASPIEQPKMVADAILKFVD